MATMWIFFVAFTCVIFQALCQGSLGPCTCDLTRNACDLDCCCDSDCTLDDKQTFSTCIVTYKEEDALSCTQSAVLYRNFTPTTSNTTSSNLFCVYFDRYSSRNFYVTPSVDATSLGSVSAAVTTYQTAYTFSDVTSGTDPASVRTVYKANVPVQVMHANGNMTGFLAHPRSGNSPDCSYANPALFLDSSTSTCAKSVTNVSCAAADSAISLASFVLGFRIAKQPTVLNAGPDYNSTDLVSIVQASVLCLDAAGVSLNCTGEPVPTLNGDNCENVLSQLTYNINYVPATGITEVTYDAVLRTVPVSTPNSMQQTFAFNYYFSSSSASDAYPRSGNPGYLNGRPIIAGRVNGSTVEVIPDPTRWVNLPVVNSDGSCAGADSTLTGQSVLFGENLRASCIRSLAWNATSRSIGASCTDINNAIISSLVGLGYGDNMSLATFGNSSVSQAGDWFLVGVHESCKRPPSQVATACLQMILGARLDLLVAKAGSVSNPQNKLVGARLMCDVGPIIFQCVAGSCVATTSTIKFLTTYTVSFIDVSTAPLEGAKQRPTYLLRLPTDFFYPLYTYSQASSVGPTGQLWLLSLAVAFISWLASP